MARVVPPVNETPLTAGGQHTQAWTGYFREVSDNLVTMARRMGVTDGSDAAAGQIGEYLTASGSSVSLSSGAAADITTLALTAGDWDVEGNIIFTPTGTTVYVAAGVSTASASLGAIVTRVVGSSVVTQQRIGTGGAARINVSAPTTAYLVAQCGFTTGAMSASGAIRARRVR